MCKGYVIEDAAKIGPTEMRDCFQASKQWSENK